MCSGFKGPALTSEDVCSLAIQPLKPHRVLPRAQYCMKTYSFTLHASPVLFLNWEIGTEW